MRRNIGWGDKMKSDICIIDSGIDEIDENYAGGINLTDEKISDMKDSSGHGSLCLRMIKTFVPEVTYHIVKILNEELRCGSTALLHALEYAADIDTKIINLSLSTPNIKVKEQLEQQCNKLRKQGKIVVASYDNKDTNRSLPAEIEGVVGVKGEFLGAGNRYREIIRGELYMADKNPVLLKRKELEFWGGNSKATACMTGMILKTLKNGSPDDSWKDILHEKEMEYNYDAAKPDRSYLTEEQTELISEIISRKLNLESWEWKHKNLIEIGLDGEKALEVLEDIEKRLGIKAAAEGYRFMTCVPLQL